MVDSQCMHRTVRASLIAVTLDGCAGMNSRGAVLMFTGGDTIPSIDGDVVSDEDESSSLARERKIARTSGRPRSSTAATAIAIYSPRWCGELKSELKKVTACIAISPVRC